MQVQRNKEKCKPANFSKKKSFFTNVKKICVHIPFFVNFVCFLKTGV